ncbi:MAG: zinc metalloprotease HtpX [Candidatus Bathyarchaeia archaeon]
MGLWQLRLAMVGTLGFIIAVSTLFFMGLMLYVGGLSLFALVGIVVVFNVVQWLFAPRLINALYRVKTISKNDNPKLYGIVERLAARSRIKMPQVGIANLPIPNAFAYGSPLTGPRVAVTSELLKGLENEEVEAVIGHELGHLKHRDVQIMMFASVLPAIFYFIGYSLLLSAMFGAGYRRGGGGGGAPIVIGALALAVYFVLSLFVLYLSRLREYYADRHSASVVDDGARKLSEGLAKIVVHTGRYRKLTRQRGDARLSNFRTLFISDPSRAEDDVKGFSRVGSFRGLSDQQLVQEIASKKLTALDRFMELFSSHPNAVKRLKTLQKIKYRME